MKTLKIKSLIIALVSISTPATAEIVEAVGYGDNFDSALRNAKLVALETVVGSFILGDRTWETDDKVFEQIKEYHGGYIKSYDVLEFKNTQVKIKADVDIIKDNRILVQGNEIAVDSNLKENLDNWKSKKEIISELDNPNKAFHFTMHNISIEPTSDIVNFKIRTTLEWQPKWISDLESFSRNSNVESNTDLSFNGELGGGMSPILVEGLPVTSIIGSIFSPGKDIKRYDQPAVCFSKLKGKDTDKCYEMPSEFRNMPRYSDSRVRIVALDKSDRVLFDQQIHITSYKLYENIYAGETKKLFLFNKTYQQPTYVIYKEGKEAYDISVKVPVATAGLINKFKLIF